LKYVRINLGSEIRWGVVKDDVVYTLADEPYKKVVYDGNSFPLSECRLVAPCTPTKIICVGKNYAEHAKEMGGEAPGFPVLFMKGINSINYQAGAVHAPEFVKRLDYEGELAVVISKRAKDVKASDFTEYVLGYTCMNDVTARDVQQHDGQWTRGKSMDGFCPVGPWVVDDINASGLRLVTRLNGAVVQSGCINL